MRLMHIQHSSSSADPDYTACSIPETRTAAPLCEAHTLPPSRLTSTEADNSRTWSPRSEAPHPPSLPTGSSSRHRHKLLTSGNQFSQKLDITNSMLQLTGKSAPQMLLYNRILKTPSKTIGVQTRWHPAALPNVHYSVSVHPWSALIQNSLTN